MLTINDLARLANGEVIGSGAITITGLAMPQSAKENEMTFAFSEDDLEKVARSKASCVLSVASKENYPKTILKVKDIKIGMTAVYNAILGASQKKENKVHPSSVISKTAKIGRNVSVGENTVIRDDASISDGSVIFPNCYVGNNVKVGSNVTLCPNVVLYDDVVLGNNVTIHAGTVIGADGFGYIPTENGTMKVPQLGRVVIEDNVEIGANTCIDRGTFVDTVIKQGTKIDNLVQIAHNVKVGNNVLIAAQTGIAGSSEVGDASMLGGQVGVADHIKIGSKVKVAAQSGVTRPIIQDGSVIFGYPARDAGEIKKQQAFMAFLFKNAEKIKKLIKSFN